MVHKLALIIGGVGAAAILALAVVLGGFTAVVTGSADATATDALVDDFAPTLGIDGSSGKVEAVVDTIFVEDSSGPDASPKPTASPSADDKGDRSADRHDDDDDSDHRDHDDDDDDRSGHRDGDDDDEDRSGHRDGGEDRDRDDD